MCRPFQAFAKGTHMHDISAVYTLRYVPLAPHPNMHVSTETISRYKHPVPFVST